MSYQVPPPEYTQEFSSLTLDTTKPQLTGRDKPRPPTAIWDHPWSQREHLDKASSLPDPYSSPIKFYREVVMTFKIYNATWSNLAALCTGAAGESFVLEVQKVEMGGEQVPDIKDQKTKKSGQQFINRLRALARKLAGEVFPGLFEVYQEDGESVSQYYERCRSLAKDQDFDVYTPNCRDARILRTCYLNGLQEDLRRKLMKMRPECKCMKIEEMLPVLTYIEKQNDKRIEENMK